MTRDDLPENKADGGETDRLAALRRHDILDTPPDRRFDRIVALVQNICQVPIALVSLVDADRQWFKAKGGVTVDQTALDTSVCALAIRGPDLFQVEDLAEDPRTSRMSLVMEEPHLRFYAGAPLISSDGHALGSLCAIDVLPRAGGLDPAQVEGHCQTNGVRYGRQAVSLGDLVRLVSGCIRVCPPKWRQAGEELALRRLDPLL